jgi:hypothetical protein
VEAVTTVTAPPVIKRVEAVITKPKPQAVIRKGKERNNRQKNKSKTVIRPTKEKVIKGRYHTEEQTSIDSTNVEGTIQNKSSTSEESIRLTHDANTSTRSVNKKIN